MASRQLATVRRMTGKGWRVTASLPDGSIVLERKQRIGIWLNLVLTVLTAGLWLVAIAIKLSNRRTESHVVPADPPEAAHATEPVAGSFYPEER